MQLLLRLVGAGVLTLRIVATITAVAHNPEMGLTADSHAANLLVVLLTFFAFLSAVL